MAKYEHEKTGVVIENAIRMVVISEEYQFFTHFLFQHEPEALADLNRQIRLVMSSS